MGDYEELPDAARAETDLEETYGMIERSSRKDKITR